MPRKLRQNHFIMYRDQAIKRELEKNPPIFKCQSQQPSVNGQTSLNQQQRPPNHSLYQLDQQQV